MRPRTPRPPGPGAGPARQAPGRALRRAPGAPRMTRRRVNRTTARRTRRTTPTAQPTRPAQQAARQTPQRALRPTLPPAVSRPLTSSSWRRRRAGTAPRLPRSSWKAWSLLPATLWRAWTSMLSWPCCLLWASRALRTRWCACRPQRSPPRVTTDRQRFLSSASERGGPIPIRLPSPPTTRPPWATTRRVCCVGPPDAPPGRWPEPTPRCWLCPRSPRSSSPPSHTGRPWAPTPGRRRRTRTVRDRTPLPSRPLH